MPPSQVHSAQICDVTTLQQSNVTRTQISQNFTFHKNASSPYFYVMMLGLRCLCMDLLLYLINRTIDIYKKKNEKNVNIYEQSQWRVVLM